MKNLYPTFAATVFSIEVLNQNASSVTLELRVHDVRIKQTKQNAQQVSIVSIAGMEANAMPGTYQLPVFGTLVGLGTDQNVALAIQGITAETIVGSAPATVPDYVVAESMGFFESSIGQEDVASRPSSWPIEPSNVPIVELGEIGYVRNQAVAQVQFSPVQYRSDGQFQVYNRIVVQISWEPEIHAANRIGSQDLSIWNELIQDVLINPDMKETTGPITVQKATTAANLNSIGADHTDSTGKGSTSLLKIGVSQTGIYRLTYTMLQNAGLDPALLDPRQLSIENQGQEIAILIVGEEDGTFNAEDSVDPNFRF